MLWWWCSVRKNCFGRSKMRVKTYETKWVTLESSRMLLWAIWKVGNRWQIIFSIFLGSRLNFSFRFTSGCWNSLFVWHNDVEAQWHQAEQCKKHSWHSGPNEQLNWLGWDTAQKIFRGLSRLFWCYASLFYMNTVSILLANDSQPISAGDFILDEKFSLA